MSVTELDLDYSLLYKMLMKKFNLKLLRILHLIVLIRLTKAFSPISKQEISIDNILKAESRESDNNVVLNKRPGRKPRGYWLDLSNVESELRLFWSDINVNINVSEPPPIPNEALLIHFDRHDLRHGIYSQGGKKIVAQILGGSRIMPGKWKDAVRTSPELIQLLDESNPKKEGLSKNIPPMPSQIKKKIEKTKKENFHLYYKNRWSHRSGRKPKGHWSEEQVLSEL